MKVANAQTEAGGRLESTALGVHANRRGRKWVFGGEHQSAPVLAIFIWSTGRTSEDVMPPTKRFVSLFQEANSD
jgi:hypothetical protein